MKVAIIQKRLRVPILPFDAKVESSNMACLPNSIQGTGWEEAQGAGCGTR
jgi:hypothetical protein